MGAGPALWVGHRDQESWMERNLEVQYVNNIDLTVAGDVTLFTTRTDMGQFVVEKMLVLAFSVDTPGTQPVLTLGSDASNDDILANRTCYLDDGRQYNIFYPNNTGDELCRTVDPGSNVILGKATLATGVSYTVTIIVKGHYTGL